MYKLTGQALAQGKERWIVVVTQEGKERTRATLTRRAKQDQEQWEQQLWHLSHQALACQVDAEAELERQLKTFPVWLRVTSQMRVQAHYGGKERPAKQTAPLRQSWQIEAALTRDERQWEQEVERRTCFIVATSILDARDLSDADAITLYKAQSQVERGFAFLKRPERIMAFSFSMVLCLLVYRLAEQRLRQALARTQQAMPDQLRRPTTRPTMRWIFVCFEGLHLVTIRGPGGVYTRVCRGLSPCTLW